MSHGNRRAKRVEQEVLHGLPVPDATQFIVRIEKPLGRSLYSVEKPLGHSTYPIEKDKVQILVCRLHPKFHQIVYVKRGMLLLRMHTHSMALPLCVYRS